MSNFILYYFINLFVIYFHFSSIFFFFINKQGKQRIMLWRINIHCCSYQVKKQLYHMNVVRAMRVSDGQRVTLRINYWIKLVSDNEIFSSPHHLAESACNFIMPQTRNTSPHVPTGDNEWIGHEEYPSNEHTCQAPNTEIDNILGYDNFRFVVICYCNYILS